MRRKRITMTSIVLATLMLVSLFVVVSSAASVSGTTMAGTGPAATTWTMNGYLDIFAVDTSHHVWYTSVMPNGGGVWNSLGGYATSSPAATSRNDGGITVFVRGMNGSIYYRDYVGSSWGPWTCIGGQVPVNVGPAVSSWGGGRLDVFVQGMNGGMYHRSYTPTSGWAKNWDYLGGTLTSGPAATSPFSAGVIDVFVRGTNGSVYQKTYNGRWSGWQSRGGQVAANTGPAATQMINDLFVQGANHHLYQIEPEAGTWTWSAFNLQPPEALSIASPGAVTTGFTMMHPLVCVSTTSGNIWNSVRDSVGNWEQWYSLGSPP